MPTFQSIQMHPELRTRLVTESSSIGLPRNPASSTNNGADSSTLTQQNPFQPIETPQALLSRHPGSLRIIDSTGSRSRPIALPQANNLRHDVAQALIATSKYGRFLHNVHERSKDQADCPISPFRVSGTISVLEMLQEKARESEFPTLTTGSFSLDRLLSFPKEYSVAPSAEMTLNHSSDPHSGIPFGYVTQFSGPPGCGKSQVALQVASSTANIKTWYLSSNPSLRSYAQRLSQLVKHYPQSVQFDVLTRTDFLSFLTPCGASPDGTGSPLLSQMAQSHIVAVMTVGYQHPNQHWENSGRQPIFKSGRKLPDQEARRIVD